MASEMTEPQLSARRIPPVKSISRTDLRKARLTCAEASADAGELTYVLDMLAIGRDFPKRWTGPVLDY